MRLIDIIGENARLSRWGQLLPRAAASRNAIHETDAELVDLGGGRWLALTVDAIEEEIRVGLYKDPVTAGRTAVVASLSDLAAVGAEPLGVLLCVTLPGEDTDRVQNAVGQGIAEACRDTDVGVLGGDTNFGDGLSLSCTAAGLVPAGAALTRAGARVGDLVYATAPLGRGALFAAATMLRIPELFSEAEWRPRPRLREGQALRGIASSCMDTSDGFIATIDQLARTSGVGIRIDRPLPELLDARAAGAPQPLAPLVLLSALHGDYELIFTVPEERTPALERAAAAIDWRPLRVGRVEAAPGLRVGDHDLDGARIRNLAAESARDPAAFVREVLAISAAMER